MAVGFIRNLGFPTTQQVADINRRAAEREQQKQEAIEREAKCVFRFAWRICADDSSRHPVRKMGSFASSAETRTALQLWTTIRLYGIDMLADSS